MLAANGVSDDWAAAFRATGWNPEAGDQRGSSRLAWPGGTSTRFDLPPPVAPRPAATGGGDVEQQIRAIAAQRGFSDPDLLVATARQESGLNARAVGDQGNSRGPFQENIRGRGAGLAPEQSFDVTGSTNRAIDEFTSIRQRFPEVDRGTWAARAQRPADAAGYASSINGMLGATPAQPVRDDWTAPFRQLGWAPEAAGPSVRGAASSPQAGSPQPVAAPPVAAATEKQALAASWALSQLGSKEFYDLCQRFIEQAYGTSGRYGSAAAAGKALFKTANPAEADVGDLVFFKPDASNGYGGHAAINLGNGEMVGATNAGVTRDNFLTNPYWRNLLVGFGDPPEQWSGRASGAALTKGAQQLVQTGQRAVAAATATADDWVSAFRRVGWNPGA